MRYRLSCAESSRGPVLLWVSILAIITVGNVARQLSTSISIGDPWTEVNTSPLLDYRDLIVTPGRFLLRGGNPYDPDRYLAAYPGAQEFDPYAPSWLILSAALGWLPLKIGAGIYLTCMIMILAWFCVFLADWATDGQCSPYLPLSIFTWCQVWYPTRVPGSSFLVLVGVSVALRFMKKAGSGSQWIAGAGVAVALLKPQFGLPFAAFVVALKGFQILWRGVVIQSILSLIPLIAAIGASGGIPQFVDAIARDVAYASSPQSPTGLTSPVQQRIDIAGVLARAGLAIMDSWQIPLSVLVVAVVSIFLYMNRSHRLAVGIIPISLVLGFVHLNYDYLMALTPAVVLGAYAIQNPSRMARAQAVLVAVPVIHLHGATLRIGFSRLQVDAIDLVALLLALLLMFVETLHSHRSKREVGIEA